VSDQPSFGAALMDLCQGDIRDLILRNSSVQIAVSLSALVLTGHFPLLEQLDVSKVGMTDAGKMCITTC